MLNKYLCAILGIDKFNQWLIKYLDYIEEQLQDPDPAITYQQRSNLRAKHDTLIEVRDTYWAINQKAAKTEATKEVAVTEDITSTNTIDLKKEK